MSRDDGLRDEMRRFFARRPDPLSLDEGTAERLLSGRLDPADAPPGFADVSRVFGAAVAPPHAEELAGEDAALATFRATIRRAGRHAGRARGLRLATLVTAALLVLGGVASAVSTGALPDGAQSVAHDALGAVGLSVPAPSRPIARHRGPARHPASRPAPTRRTARARPGPPPSPPARRAPTPPPSTAPRMHRPADSLVLAACHAYLQGRISPTGGRSSANAYRYLTTRAGGAGNVGGFCQGVVRAAGP